MIETVFRYPQLQGKRSSLSRKCSGGLGMRLPVWISAPSTDLSGRTLTGSDPDRLLAFGAPWPIPFAIWLNCALGAKELRPLYRRIGRCL